ncbi:MAG: hypothetical protein JXQ76_13405 [Campylobacterales bacterium]|nr:hypothetical protein [Campylobacterales bacterium]
MTDYFVQPLLEELKKSDNPLHLAYKAQDLSAKVGFDFDSPKDAFSKVREECFEIEEALYDPTITKEHLLEEIGDGFFALTNLARQLGVSPQELIHNATLKYLKRVEYIEERLKANAQSWSDTSFEELDSYWDEAKTALKS